MKKMNSLLVKGFQTSKCKTQLRLGTSRIKLLRNKKGIQIASDRREVAEFLRNGQENSARLRVEHVIREQDLIEAYDLLYLYAERIAAQLSVIDSQKTCPPDLKEDISTLLFASARCAELTDFAQIRPMFVAKYGKEFVAAAVELRPGCGVNGRVIEKLSVSRATGEAKLKVMKDIAAEHNVEWDPASFESEITVVRDDLLDGPSVFTSAESLPTVMHDFPSVPNQKPTLGTHLSPSHSMSQPDNSTHSTSGRFIEDKVEHTDMPRPADGYQTGSQSAVSRSGPSLRKPPGREQSSTEDLPFDYRDAGMGPDRGETLPRRNPRRESDIYPAPSPQARYEVRESRRNSIGVPREKSGRAHTGSGFPDRDESLSLEHKKYNQRNSQVAEVDDSEDAGSREDVLGREYESGLNGSHRSDRRQSQKFDQYAGKGQVRGADADQSYSRNSRLARTSREEELIYSSDEGGEKTFAKTRSGTDGSRRNQTRHDQDPLEDTFRTISRSEGSGKVKSHKQEQAHDEDHFRRVPSKEDSGKARSHHQDHEPEEHNMRRASSKDSFGNRMGISIQEGSQGRISSRSKEGKQYAGNVRIHDGSNVGADRVPHQSEEPRLRDSTNNTPKYVEQDNCNPEWDNESIRNSVTKRIPRNAEEYRNSGDRSQRDSQNRRLGASSEDNHSPHFIKGDDVVRKKGGAYVDDTSRKSNNPSVMGKDDESYFNGRATSNAPRYDSSEDEDDSPGTRKSIPRQNNYKAINTRNSDRSSESGEEGFRKDTRQTPRLSNVDERRRDNQFPNDPDVQVKASSRGRRHGREDVDSLKTSRHSEFDSEQVDFEDESFSTSSRTPNNHTERRMSLPGGSVRDKAQYRGNISNDDYDDTVRPSDRRMTIGPEGLRSARGRETEEAPPRSRYEEKEKRRDARRQSAPKSESMVHEDDMERRRSPNLSSQRDRSDRYRKSDSPVGYVDEKPPRFSNPKVGSHVSSDDEYTPNSYAQRDRSDRQRKSDSPASYDGDKPPRFTNVGKQSTMDDEYLPSERSSPGFKGEKPQRFVNSPRSNDEYPQATPRARSKLQSAKTDPDLPSTPRVSSSGHRKSQSAVAESASKAAAVPTSRLQKPSSEERVNPQPVGQPQSKPAFLKPPDLDDLILMFGNKGKKK